MANLELKNIKDIVEKIVRTVKGAKIGDTKVLLCETELEEINGINEPLYVTKIINDAVVVHYGTVGDWTKAVLITRENLDCEESIDYFDPADEALEWFFN